MKPLRTIAFVSVVLLLAASFGSCKAIKNFLNTELEDEDYIVGQLYADEYVKENPVRMQRPSSGAHSGSASPGSRSGIELNDKDNRKL